MSSMATSVPHDYPIPPGTGGALLRTPLYELHLELGAKLVPFAGYYMPVQYRQGIIHEHSGTRSTAGLFDVSHMGQAFLHGPSAAVALQRLVCGDIEALKPGRQRYTLLLNEQGGIIDDLMVSRRDDRQGEQWLYLVVNAARKDVDFAHIRSHISGQATLDILSDRALIALQGPRAADILGHELPRIRDLAFMQSLPLAHSGHEIIVSRSGYTGEDGFEISIPAERAEIFARMLLKNDAAIPAGLGARDSLRLEAGLCLYGNDIDETTSPIEAGLEFALSKKRLETADFPGATRIVAEWKNGPVRKRIGIHISGRQPVREGETILVNDAPVGRVTSGGYGPSLKAPIAMGYIATEHTAPGTELTFTVRGKKIDARIAPLPFIQPRYHRRSP
jgi:aminomethyltransferase